MKTFERILKDELLIITSHLFDGRQHGFLNFKSCTTNIFNITDKLVMSINDTQTLSTDVIYFDFSKAFDSVNHDLILHKLKYEYAIDGSLLIRSLFRGQIDSKFDRRCLTILQITA